MAFSERRPKDLGLRRRWEEGDVYCLQDLEHKYIVHTRGKDEFFDLRQDPLELHSLETLSPRRDRLGHLARATFAAAEREGGALIPSAVDPRLTEELQALGYVGDNE